MAEGVREDLKLLRIQIVTDRVKLAKWPKGSERISYENPLEWGGGGSAGSAIQAPGEHITVPRTRPESRACCSFWWERYSALASLGHRERNWREKSVHKRNPETSRWEHAHLLAFMTD